MSGAPLHLARLVQHVVGPPMSGELVVASCRGVFNQVKRVHVGDVIGAVQLRVALWGEAVYQAEAMGLDLALMAERTRRPTNAEIWASVAPGA